MDAYTSLIAAAEAWAAKTRRPLDPNLLHAALRRHDDSDRAPGTAWPTGSAEPLLADSRLAPSTDRDALVRSLDTYWRFLRATGRMASGSADPKALTKEAQRAARRAAGQRTPRSTPAEATSLGRREFEEGMAELVDQFRAELDEKRIRSGFDDDLDDLADDDPWDTWAAERWENDDCPGCDECGWEGDRFEAGRLLQAADFKIPGLTDLTGIDLPIPDDGAVRELVTGSGYFQNIQRLCAWLGDRGRPVTDEGWLTLCAARQAVTVLDLDEWVRTVLDEEPELEERAGEHEGLGRLHQPAVNAGFIDIRGARAYPVTVLPSSDEEWASAACALLLEAHAWVSEIGCGPLVLGLLLHLAMHGSLSRTDLEDWWRSAPANDIEGLSRMFEQTPDGLEMAATTRAADDRRFRSTLAWWMDTAVWRESGGQLEITDLGITLLHALIAIMRDHERDSAA